MKKCVIFDMDGVIVDSEHIHMACEREIFRLMGISVSDEEHYKMIGTSDDYMWSHISQLYSLTITVPELINRKKSLYMEYLKRGVYIKLIPYVSGLIVDLFSENIPLVLASSSPHEQIDYILNDFALKRFFHASISGEDILNSKPHPEIFLKAAKAVGVDPGSCVVIEDSENGVLAAKNAKMKCIGYKNLNSGDQDLSKADLVVSSFNEVSVVSIKGLLWQ